LLGRRITTWSSLPALFVLVIFEIGSHFLSRQLSSYLCWDVAGMRVAQPFVEIGSQKFFAEAGLKLKSSQFLPPK
jgi:hypothetical protein